MADDLDRLVAQVAALEPFELAEFMSRLAHKMSERAETVYDKDPENNGRLAQPYADLYDLLADAANVFVVEDEPDLDDEPVTAHTRPTTVTDVVQRRIQDPWGEKKA